MPLQLHNLSLSDVLYATFAKFNVKMSYLFYRCTYRNGPIQLRQATPTNIPTINYCLFCILQMPTLYSVQIKNTWKLSILAVQSNILEQSQWYICMKQDTRQTPAGCCIHWGLSVWDSWWRCWYKDMDWLRKGGKKLGCLLNNNDTFL